MTKRKFKKTLKQPYSVEKPKKQKPLTQTDQ
jgi:hypothetical protein